MYIQRRAFAFRDLISLIIRFITKSFFLIVTPCLYLSDYLFMYFSLEHYIKALQMESIDIDQSFEWVCKVECETNV